MSNLLIQERIEARSFTTVGDSSTPLADLSGSQVCRLVVIYDDQAARDRAFSLFGKLRSTFAGEVAFVESWWKFSVLQGKALLPLAVGDAAQADLLLFSLGAMHDMPDALVAFNDLWVGERNGRAGLLAVLAHQAVSGWPGTVPIESYFKDLAGQAGIDFITSLATHPPHWLATTGPLKLNHERLLKPLIDEYFYAPIPWSGSE